MPDATRPTWCALSAIIRSVSSERLRQADRVRSLVEASEAAGPAVVDAWREDLGSHAATINDLEKLAILAAGHLRKQQIRAQFGYD
ncbi:hypothetical protein AB9E15_33320, partial [Rhizobium leguminosarum]|uniref:hypothetical protein n=1 Tax=Rhizobium leguminosarum TaxID=384 RepID=UPI003F9D7644